MLHCGLYFTPEHIQLAQRERNQEPFLSAWMYLRDREQSGVTEALWCGLRYRFGGDSKAGDAAVRALEKHCDDKHSKANTYLEAVFETLALAHAYEMVRDYSGFASAAQRRWIDFFTGRVNTLENSSEKDTLVEILWMALLNLAGGIVLENESMIQGSAGLFQKVIGEDVRPQGFIPKAVDGKDGGSLYRQILAASALVLMAEAASHVGVDLWSYTVRGVSVVTGAMYPIYYFYTPEKWQWDEGISVDEAQNLFRQYGGYLEMLYRRTRHKDLTPLLQDLRPIYTPYAGGLTTLTHGVPEKRRGLFR
jgi:hypothetical protein